MRPNDVQDRRVTSLIHVVRALRKLRHRDLLPSMLRDVKRPRESGARDSTRDGTKIFGMTGTLIAVGRCGLSDLGTRGRVLSQDAEAGFDQSGEAFSTLASEPLGRLFDNPPRFEGLVHNMDDRDRYASFPGQSDVSLAGLTVSGASSGFLVTSMLVRWAPVLYTSPTCSPKSQCRR